jgi:monothiol glutaredoxin
MDSDMTTDTNTRTREAIEAEIQAEITQNKLMFYGKGTKAMPRCGFTMETIQFFEKYPYELTVIDVLEDQEKRQVLSELTQWPTLPKVFIGGKFYGDTDILDEMEKSGELQQVLEATFGKA